MFLGTTAVNPGGNPYDPSSSMGVLTVTSVARGDWYFSIKYVNSIGESNFSASSSKFTWRPLTWQFTGRYLAIAYATNATGTAGFSYNPRNKTYYGIYNNVTTNGGVDPSIYTWYPASFSTANYILHSNRSNRKTSIAVGNAGYVNLGGTFVPTETSIYDSNLWSALLDPTGGLQSFIDLDARTGQTIISGSTGNNVNLSLIHI